MGLVTQSLMHREFSGPVPPNPAFERPREKRAKLRNDHRCARAAQREPYGLPRVKRCVCVSLFAC